MQHSRLGDKDPLYIELYNAIAYFLSRQRLVILVVMEQGVDPADLAKGVAGWYDKTPSRGTWGSEWRFGFHGGGCLLINNLTREEIDWTGPDTSRFSPYSFTRHLKWRLAHGHDLPLLREYVDEHGSDAVNKLIKELMADGLVSTNYHLLPRLDDAPRASAA